MAIPLCKYLSTTTGEMKKRKVEGGGYHVSFQTQLIILAEFMLQQKCRLFLERILQEKHWQNQFLQ